ncbi:MAG: spermine synthase, partial [Syntrophus sp. (in: bacteria)]|nr:spermine synthase [Syntrophus sp. (in: bacteria)]
MDKRNRCLFIFALFVTGLSGIVAQTVLLRELLILFSGNELSIGIIISSWVIWEAIGAYGGGTGKRQLTANIRMFSYITLLFSLSFPLSVYGTRIFKVLVNIPPEVGVGLIPIFYASFCILLPAGLLHGFLFTLSCSIWNQITGKCAASSGKVYFYEMTGTMVGGILVSYLFIPLYNSFLIAIVIALLCGLACLILILSFFRFKERLPLYLTGALAVLSLILLFSNSADHIQQYAIERQWLGKNVIHYENSIYQNIVVVKTEDQYTFFSDGLPVITTPVPDIAFVEEFVHIPLLAHPSPERILIIGGGAGGMINEVLKYGSVKRIDYVELDPLLLKMVTRFPTVLIDREIYNPLVHLHFLDGRMYLKQPPCTYDIILLGFPPPHTLQQNRFFSKEFFESVRKALDKDGVFALTMTGSLSY